MGVWAFVGALALVGVMAALMGTQPTPQVAVTAHRDVLGDVVGLLGLAGLTLVLVLAGLRGPGRRGVPV